MNVMQQRILLTINFFNFKLQSTSTSLVFIRQNAFEKNISSKKCLLNKLSNLNWEGLAPLVVCALLNQVIFMKNIQKQIFE